MLVLNKRQIGIVLGVVVLLLIPFVAMQFIDQVYWTPFDFLIAFLLLLVAGCTGDWAWRKIHKFRNHMVLLLIIFIALLLIWAELAVGIFGTQLAGS